MKNQKLMLVIYLSVLLFSQSAAAEIFQSDGMKIHYTDTQGEGEVIVLIHGYSMDSSMWHEAGIVAELSKHHRVIALDCRGHGNSEKPENPKEYGPKVGKDTINLINHLGIKKAHLVGYSMGAYIVGRLLVTNPNRVHTAIMASGFFPTDNKEELLFQENTAKEMESQGKHALAAIARGWRYDAVSDQQVGEITVPMQAVFGSEEIDDFFNSQKYRLTMPKSALPVVVIEGADHGSNKAAVLHPKFLETVGHMVSSFSDLQ